MLASFEEDEAMSKLSKDIDKLQSEMKDVKNALGLDTDTGKNIKILLDTIRTQGMENKELVGATEYQNEALNLRNEFINKDPGMKAAWELFLKMKDTERTAAITAAAEAQQPGNVPALELIHEVKKPIDTEICAPHATDVSKTMCGELKVESQIIKNGQFVTCPSCLEILDGTEKKPPGPIPEPKAKPGKCSKGHECGVPPAEPVAAPEDKQPQDTGGKIKRK